MRIRRWVVTMGLAVVCASGCSRHRQEAVKLSNEADGFVSTDPGSAIEKYEQATKFDPQNPRIFYKLALANQANQDWSKTAVAARRAAELRDANADYWYLEGFALFKLAEKSAKKEDYEKAAKALSAAIERDENYDEAYYYLGLAYEQADEEQKALDSYREAVKRRPQCERKKMSCISYYSPWASLLIANLNLSEAEVVLKAAKEMTRPGNSLDDTEMVDVHTLLAKVYRSKNDVDAQIKELEAAWALRKEPELMFNLGMAYAKAKPPRVAEAKRKLDDFRKRGCSSEKGTKLYGSKCQQATSVYSKLGKGP